MKTWSARSLKGLEGIHPDLRKIMDRALESSPIDFVITEGLRTKARQVEMVAKGASKTMKSRHITGHAVDLVPLLDLDKDGKIEVEEMYNWPVMRKLAPWVVLAAKDVHIPIEWGGTWTTFPDGPHYQLPFKAYP